MKRNVQNATRVTLERVQQSYAELLKSTTFSLHDLFSHDGLQLNAYCKTFHPHPQSNELKKIAQVFGEEYDIWLENAKYYITCALFLYPTAHFSRMITMTKNLAIGYYLNDTIGREIFGNLTPYQQQQAKNIIRRMSTIGENLELPMKVQPVELANVEMLTEIRKNSPKAWFSEFLKFYSYYIGITHKDCTAAALGHIPSVNEYIDMRYHTSGMPHIVLLVEYSDGQFLDWNWLKRVKLSQTMERLHWVTAIFGSLTNDLFSFEKEVIDEGSDSNLLMAIALNEPELTLQEIILKAAGIVRDLLVEYVALVDEIRQQCNELPQSKMLDTLYVHMAGLERCIQASWMWQVYTQRYKHAESIWAETQLASLAASAV